MRRPSTARSTNSSPSAAKSARSSVQAEGRFLLPAVAGCAVDYGRRALDPFDGLELGIDLPRHQAHLARDRLWFFRVGRPVRRVVAMRAVDAERAREAEVHDREQLFGGAAFEEL